MSIKHSRMPCRCYQYTRPLLASCASRWDGMFTFCSPLSVTNIGERSCSLAAGRGAEPSSPRTGRVLLCAPLSAQLVAVRHRAVAALRAM